MMGAVEGGFRQTIGTFNEWGHNPPYHIEGYGHMWLHVRKLGLTVWLNST